MSGELRFQFRLRPVDEITPWRSDGKARLSWFGLSDGWYWIDAGGQELFRSRDDAEGVPPYVDYQVVRLWEDVLELLPHALADVPDALARQLDDGDRWLERVERIYADDALDPKLIRAGLAWWHARCLDVGHLTAAPRLWLWRTGDRMHATWRSAAHPSAAQLWQPVAGSLDELVEHFVAELQRFDREFLTAMGERIETLVRAGGRAGVDIDLAHLALEQRQRSTWLANALAAPPPAVDWDAARRLLERA